MKIKIENCNCIDSAEIQIHRNKLNIKYALNGTGKSTISKAILLSCEKKSLEELVPYKYQNEDKSKVNFRPSVSDIPEGLTVKVFNDEYINKFVFLDDELIKNSFKIFIKDQNYENYDLEIKTILKNITEKFSTDSELEKIIENLKKLESFFGTPTKTASYRATSVIGKFIKNGGDKTKNLPEEFKHYSVFLENENCINWADWQSKGEKFLDISHDSCPYCVTGIKEKKETIRLFQKHIDKDTVEAIVKLKSVYECVKAYLSTSAVDTFEAFFKAASENKDLTKEANIFLENLRGQAGLFAERLSNIKHTSFFSLNLDEVEQSLKDKKIEIKVINNFDSKETQIILDQIHKSIDEAITKVGQLKAALNRQQGLIQKSIKENKTAINGFLRNAGYEYEVDLVKDESTSSYKLKLFVSGANKEITNKAKNLSYGEKNALAMLLFMFECKNENTGLIILDDPISSFDEHKKYALLESIFRSEAALKGKTVLMLTHDSEPIIDMLYVKKDIFGQSTEASFLERKNGVIKEKNITKSDIMSFSAACDKMMSSDISSVNKLVYLRRLYEVLNNHDLAYELLSSLLHKRQKPSRKLPDGQLQDLTEAEILSGTKEIEKRINDFEYYKYLSNICDDENMRILFERANFNTAKLQVFRIINEQKKDAEQDSVFKKYINETFHIENEYIMQLDPEKFDLTPDYIVSLCKDKMLDSVEVKK